ncbi:hypothetical protein WDU94_010363 [Cyamophila willieti]
MEEAVTRKFVHQDSGTITSFCGAVEACLSQGLRRRALGLFKTSSTTALLHKIGKYFEPAGLISQQVQELEGAEAGNRRLSSSGEQSKHREKPPLLKKTSSSGSNAQNLAPSPLPKYLWIRLALFERVLASIIDYLVQNASKYYDANSLVADPDCGSILSSLLVGPCALEYSRSKTSDHYWTDPPADELLQRHRISTTPPSNRRPHMNQYGRSLNAKSSEEIRQQPSVASAKDYVESLHQNSRATLLYGKNNVLVCPNSRATLLYGKNNVLVRPEDVPDPMAGYLSLHQTSYECSALLLQKDVPDPMAGYLSLHQTSYECSALLLQKDVPDPMAGYLSLHQTSYECSALLLQKDVPDPMAGYLSLHQTSYECSALLLQEDVPDPMAGYLSLHQTSYECSALLLQKDVPDPMAGYLSLHQTSYECSALLLQKDVPDPMAGYLSLHQTSYECSAFFYRKMSRIPWQDICPCIRLPMNDLL